MLLDTIRQNVSHRRTSEKLIERIAEVPNLPVELVPAFRDFTRIQGWTVLRTVNDWLESRRATSGSVKLFGPAYVHAYSGKATVIKRH